MADVNTNVTETVTTTAENNGGGHQGDVGNPADTVSTNEGAEKTFTQTEVDEIVKQRLASDTQMILTIINSQNHLKFELYESLKHHNQKLANRLNKPFASFYHWSE